MTRRPTLAAARARRARRIEAMARPEPRDPGDGMVTRGGTATPTGMAAKKLDPAVRALIDAALAVRREEEPRCARGQSAVGSRQSEAGGGGHDA